MIKKLSLLMTALSLAFLPGCSKNPVTGKNELHLVSQSQEVNIGEANYVQMQQAEGGPYVTDENVQNYVREVGLKLVKESDRPDLPFEFVVLNNSVPNAWALPGGKIAINRGLLVELRNEAELAAVLAHEIVHSAARHTAKNIERGLLMSAGLIGLNVLMDGHKYEDVAMGSAILGSTLLNYKYSRGAELEADHYGIKYMQLAGYDPRAAIDLQKTFLRLSEERGVEKNWLAGLFATHPPSEERVAANEVTAATYPAEGFIGEKEYEKAMAHMRQDETAYANLDKGYKELKDNKPEEALRLANAGIKLAPKEAHLYNLKGKAELKLGNQTEALASFKRAIDLNPNYFDFYVQKGLLEERMGNSNAARKDLNQSLTLLPTAEAHYVLGIQDVKARKRWEALEHFRIASQSNSPVGKKARELAIRLAPPRLR
jgi:predicted Zn-dependent protease